MTSRLDTPDTDADREIRHILDLQRSTGFTVIAGAGSGKTTSLVKALAHITDTRGSALLAKTQRVACITYTEVAAAEIHADLGNDPLAAVSTIHSFLWSLVKPFHNDISAWVSAAFDEKIATLLAKQANYPKGTHASTRTKDDAALEKAQHQQRLISEVTHWQYGVGSDYARGVLGHNDILKMVPQMVTSRKLLSRIVSRQYPFIFVDESQDTFPEVVECLSQVWTAAQGAMCLGFFGDPMQQIYLHGAGSIALRPDWLEVAKPQNFRSSRRVLACVNAVRAEADSLQQVSGLGDSQTEGNAYLFVLPADGDRSANLEKVRARLDEYSQPGQWTRSARDGGAKVLMIAHRMAARRLGFENLHSAFTDKAGYAFEETFKDGTAWPLTPFRDVIVPLCTAAGPGAPEVLGLLRRYSPIIRDAPPSAALRAQLTAARTAVQELRNLAGTTDVTLGEVLNFAAKRGLVELDPRMSAFLEPDGVHREAILDERTNKVLEAMTRCAFAELSGYYVYVNHESPYSTQHGTKGTEFDRVVVVLDDDEGHFNQYSYEKLLGLKALSATDIRNRDEGRDTTVDRTRRLLYVCVSRARQSLVIVLFVADPAGAVDSVERSALGPHVDIRGLSDL